MTPDQNHEKIDDLEKTYDELTKAQKQRLDQRQRQMNQAAQEKLTALLESEQTVKHALAAIDQIQNGDLPDGWKQKTPASINGQQDTVLLWENDDKTVHVELLADTTHEVHTPNGVIAETNSKNAAEFHARSYILGYHEMTD